ncbi:MAG: GTPase [Chloroflexota bacterium]|nr:GTPase [Chloroflexota bacterium]
MPANLPPQYYEAEKNLRTAKNATEKILVLEELLGIMPKHKGTDHLRAELRTRIAKLTQQEDKKAGTHRASMVIDKEGAAQVAVVGLPNAGKSQLVGAITNASPLVADYPFTTHSATPGMMEFENIKIQLIDTPPLVPQAIEFWLVHLLRAADALLVLLDLNDAPLDQMEAVMAQLEKMRIAITKPRPDIAELIIAQPKALIVGNKLDLPNARHNLESLQAKYGDQLPVVGISAKDRTGLEDMKLKLFQVLDIIRVYTKTPGQKADFNDTIILKKGSTLEDGAAQVHKDFAARLKYARIWGSGKHDGVMAKRDHVLQDGDVIELHL